MPRERLALCSGGLRHSACPCCNSCPDSTSEGAQSADVESQAPFGNAAGTSAGSSLQPCLAGLQPRQSAGAQLGGKPGLVFPRRGLDPAVRGEGGLRGVPKACRGGGGAGRGQGGGRGTGAAGSRRAGWRRARAGRSLRRQPPQPPPSLQGGDRLTVSRPPGGAGDPEGVDHGGEIPGE